MPSYTAPTKDMQYLLHDVLKIAEYDIPGYEELDRAFTEAVLTEAGKLAANVLQPLNQVGDEEGCRLENGVVRTPTGFQEAYRQMREGGWIVAGIVISFVAAILIGIGMQVLDAVPPTNFSAAAAAERPVLVYGPAIVGALFIIGPIEEYFYRGIVQGRLREQMGAVPAIAIVSVGFALGHVPSYWIGGSELLSLGVFFALLSIAVASVIFGAIYERTQNLVVVIVIHSLINAISFSVALVAALGA